MHIKEKIILLCGKSGSGKTTIAQLLEDKYNMNVLQSYTTRPKRSPDETGHTFITDEDFDCLCNICAYGEFGGYRYCATQDQVDNADVYVIDGQGIEYFKKTYRGIKKPIVIYVSVPCVARFKRLIKRDGIIKGLKRWFADIPHFHAIKKLTNYSIKNSFGKSENCAYDLSMLINGGKIL